jgi:hypothetical protein
MEVKDEIIKRLNAALVKRESAMQQEQLNQAARFEAKHKQLTETARDTEALLRTKLQAAEDELAQVDSFRREKDSFDAKLDEATRVADENTVKYAQELGQQERKFIAEQSELVRDLERQTEHIREEAKQKARVGLGHDTTAVVNDNKRMVSLAACSSMRAKGMFAEGGTEVPEPTVERVAS